MSRLVHFTCGILLAACWFNTATDACAQGISSGGAKKNNSQDPEKPKLDLELDVLIQTGPSYRVKAQEWGRAFQDVGYTPQFRQPKPGEAIRIENVEIDGKRSIRVVCGMSVDGSLSVRDRKFTIADGKELKAFLDEVSQFGAGGPPEKDAKWGMTDEQLQDLLRRLSDPITTEISLESPLVTIESIGLPEGVRMKFKESARESALGRRPKSAPESLNLIGYSKGTAIAIVLAQYGLGFRPEYVAAKNYEIEIDLGGESNNLWPAGWKAQESTSVIFPAYMKAIPVDVEEAEVAALLKVISDRLKVPFYRSSHVLASEGKDVEVLTYTRKSDKVSPSKLLTAIGDKLQLGFDVRVDESGKIFVWATTAEESAAFRSRFAHIRQKY